MEEDLLGGMGSELGDPETLDDEEEDGKIPGVSADDDTEDIEEEV